MLWLGFVRYNLFVLIWLSKFWLLLFIYLTIFSPKFLIFHFLDLVLQDDHTHTGWPSPTVVRQPHSFNYPRQILKIIALLLYFYYWRKYEKKYARMPWISQWLRSHNILISTSLLKKMLKEIIMWLKYSCLDCIFLDFFGRKIIVTI